MRSLTLTLRDTAVTSAVDAGVRDRDGLRVGLREGLALAEHVGLTVPVGLGVVEDEGVEYAEAVAVGDVDGDAPVESVAVGDAVAEDVGLGVEVGLEVGDAATVPLTLHVLALAKKSTLAEARLVPW